jgi:hypothetical protein
VSRPEAQSRIQAAMRAVSRPETRRWTLPRCSASSPECLREERPGDTPRTWRWCHQRDPPTARARSHCPDHRLRVGNARRPQSWRVGSWIDTRTTAPADC